MKLERAIKILTIHNDHNPDFTDAERREAHQLSIEALKLYMALKATGSVPKRFSGIGETKD